MPDPNTEYESITKTEAGRLARQARRYGHFDTGRTLWLKCPKCQQRVEEDKQPTSRVSAVKQLDAMMLHHFAGYCESAQTDSSRS